MSVATIKIMARVKSKVKARTFKACPILPFTTAKYRGKPRTNVPVMAAEKTKSRSIRKKPKKPGLAVDLAMKLKNMAIRAQYKTVPSEDSAPAVDAFCFSRYFITRLRLLLNYKCVNLEVLL
jgi:hypothetical protein